MKGSKYLLFINKIKFETFVLLSLMAILSFFTLYSIPPADTWLNLATGKYIVKNLEIPTKDVFSYTAGGSPWIATQWLTVAGCYIIYAVSGLKGLYLLRTIILLFIFYIIYSTCSLRKLNPLLSGIILVCSIYLSQPYYYFDIRAYLISYLFIISYIFLLEKRKREKIIIPLWLFPLFNIIWVNTHSAFWVGFFIIFAYFVDECFSGEESRRSSLFLIKVGLLTFLSSLINPYTYKIIIYPFRLGLGSGFWQKFLIEWNPPDIFGTNMSFAIFWIISGGFIILTIRKGSLSDLIIWAGFSFMAFRAVRHITIFFLIITPIIVKHIELFFLWKDILLKKCNPGKYLLKRNKYMKAILTVIIMLIFLRTVITIFTTDFSLEKEMFPYYGVKFIKENKLPGRVYNPYEWGGYLMWTMYPEKLVFFDGRAETVYSEEICKEGYFAMAGQDLNVFDKYNINIILCNKINEPLGMNLPSVLKEKPDQWCLIYSDENTYIFIKNNMANKNIINKFYSGNLFIPDSPEANYYEASVLLQKENYDKALKFIEKGIEIDEEYLECWMIKGYIMAKKGKLNEAEICFLEVLKIDPKYPSIHYNLGLIYEISGNNKKAEEEFIKELEINDYDPAKEALKRIEERK